MRSQIERDEGIEEGLKKGVLLVAAKLKEQGVDCDIIAESTGLSLEQINEL